MTPSTGSPVVLQLIQQQGGQFSLMFNTDLHGPVAVPAPSAAFLEKLTWLLEEYKSSPGGPFAKEAPLVKQALTDWGEAAFQAVFTGRKSWGWLAQAQGSPHGWRLRIHSSDPGVLSWPWEALRDPETGVALSLSAGVERVLSNVNRPGDAEAAAEAPLEILLVISRPLENDIPFLTLSGPMVQTLAESDRDVRVTLLRPPTFDQLRKVLRENPGRFHVLHFDGHGVIKDGGGLLLFETARGKPEEVRAEQLAVLMQEHRIPAVVLGACQSGQVAGQTFKAVAPALSRGQVRSVVAMSHALHRDGAKRFVPAFYRALVEGRPLPEGVRAGRLAMHADQKREAYGNGTVELPDWLLPVLYVNNAAPLPHIPHREPPLRQRPRPWVGHDRYLRRIEQALLTNTGIIHVTGDEGMGCTRLLSEAEQWLRRTGWPGEILRLDVDSLERPVDLLDQLGMPIFGQDFFVKTNAAKLRLLQQHPGQRLLILDDADGLGGALKRQLVTLIEALPQITLLVVARDGWLPMGGVTVVRLEPLGRKARHRLWQELHARHPPCIADPQSIGALLSLLKGCPLLMVALLPLLQRFEPADLLDRVRALQEPLDEGRHRHVVEMASFLLKQGGS